MIKRLLLAAAAAASLSACASTPNPLDVATRDAGFIKDATVVWSFEDAKYQQNPNYNPGKAETIERLESAVESAFRTSPSGSTPLTFKIDVKNYMRPNAAVSHLVGGSHMITADVHVLRESDGAEIGVYENVFGMYGGSGGVIGLAVQAAMKPDIEQVLANSFAANLRARFDGK